MTVLDSINYVRVCFRKVMTSVIIEDGKSYGVDVIDGWKNNHNDGWRLGEEAERTPGKNYIEKCKVWI